MRSEGSSRSEPARRGRLSFAYFSLAKQRKVSAPSARDAWLKLHQKLTTKHQLISKLPLRPTQSSFKTIKSSLKTSPMEYRRFADILHLGKSAMLCLKQLATRRRRSNSFQAALNPYLKKGSLKIENRLVVSQTVFCWVDWFSGCLSVYKNIAHNPIPTISQRQPETHSPTKSPITPNTISLPPTHYHADAC